MDDIKLIKPQQKKILNEERIKYTKVILTAENFTEALQYKLTLEDKGVPIDINIYYELLFRCNDYQTACKLKEEMDIAGCALDERTYRCLIKRVPSHEERLALLHEMKVKGIKPTIKTYFVLIKKAEDIEEALILFREMKSRNIIPDVGIYRELLRLARGTKYHSKIKSDMDNFTQLEALVGQVDTYAYIKFSVRKAKEWCLEYDVEFFNDMFLNLTTSEDIVSLLNLIEAEGFSYSHRTYIAFIQAYSKKAAINDLQMYRRKIEIGLSSAEYAKLSAYKQELAIEGGLGKVNIKTYQIIDEIKQGIVNQEDLSSQFFQLGIIDGIESENRDFTQGIEDALDEIELLETYAVEDRELFVHSIEFQQGVIEGIKKRQAIYCDIRDKHLPILIIAYVTDEEALALLRRQALLWEFYEYDLDNVGNFKVNGCLFTSSLAEFQTILNHVSFIDSYDVAIGIMDGEDSLNFADNMPELGRYLYSLQYNNFGKVGFYSWKSCRKNDSEELFAKFYNGVVIKSLTSKKNKKV